MSTPASSTSLIMEPVTLDSSRPAKYARSFQDIEGNVHVMGLFKVSYQYGDLICRAQYEPSFPPTALNEGLMNSFFCKPGFFLSICPQVTHESGDHFAAKAWRSEDDLKTITEFTARFVLPEAGKVDYDPTIWSGLFCHRSIIQLADGSLLASLYGNFEADTTPPSNPQSKIETKYKLRVFVVRSTDNGATWHYLASLAVPDPNKPDDSEGYNEWTMTQLNDGRILAVIRTGHFTPFVLCYSSDNGKTWTDPVVSSELGPAGCDPYLLKLSDGRVALSYGQMVQPPADSAQRAEYFLTFEQKGDTRRHSRLAISTTPAADHWITYDLTKPESRSAYSSIFQMSPELLLYQTDLELYKIEIPAPQP